MKRSAHARMRYLCFAVLIALGVFAFPGSTEIDAQVFAINIGIDRLTNGMVRVTVQMPSGIPVAAVAIDGAVNAALLCVQILAVSEPELAEKLAAARKRDAQKVLEADAELSARFNQ